MYLLIIHAPCANSNNSVPLPLFPSEVPCLEIENLFRTSKTGFCDKRIKRNVNKWQKYANCWQRYLPSPTLMILKRRCLYNPTPITQTKGFYLPTLCLDGESTLGICIISFTILESCSVARNNTCTKYMKLRWVMMKGENERRGEGVVWIYYKYIYLSLKKKTVVMGGLQLSIFDTQACALQAWSLTINILKENVS